jgi:hypothetical protein
MAIPTPPARTKYFTVAEANATLPYVRAIVRDVTELANELRERHERLSSQRLPDGALVDDSHREELEQAEDEFQRDQARLREFERELQQIGVELKDYFTGLIDFPSIRDGRPVYLCWKLGEPEVAHWHEIEAGFAGRQKLKLESRLVHDKETTRRD